MGTKCMGGTEGHVKSFPKTEKRLAYKINTNIELSILLLQLPTFCHRLYNFRMLIVNAKCSKKNISSSRKTVVTWN